jgi:hypothetical protein
MSAKSGRNVKIIREIRSTPIEKLPDPDHIEGEAVFVITDKINEIIDRLNRMNEV